MLNTETACDLGQGPALDHAPVWQSEHEFDDPGVPEGGVLAYCDHAARGSIRVDSQILLGPFAAWLFACAVQGLHDRCLPCSVLLDSSLRSFYWIVHFALRGLARL